MARSRKPKEPKLPAGVSKELVEALERATPQEKKEMIVIIQSQISESRAFLKGNIAVLPEERIKGAEQLKDLRDDYIMSSAPIKEAIRHLNNRSTYIMDQLKKDTGI